MTGAGIRLELALLIEKKQISCKTQSERNKAVNDARSEINKKYGKEWRHKETLETNKSK